jgi:hypothetical protein
METITNLSNNIALDILNNKSDDIEIVKKIYNVLYDYYNNKPIGRIIPRYTKKYIVIKKSKDFTTDFLIMREKIYYLVHKYTNIKVVENICGLDKIFYTMTVFDEFTINLFLCYAMFYQINTEHSIKDHYIGLDFEFSQAKIALAQIGFFPKRKFKFIFVLNPTILSEQQKKLYIKTIFTSNIQKIVHGAESLDIPYIFNELFEGNKEYIEKFINYMHDTRFLCEYDKIFYDKFDKKCSIYDALLYFNVIKQSKYDEFAKNYEIMGPIQDVQWQLKKMSSFHLKYVLYDVLYLKGFIKQIFDNAEKNNTTLFEHLKFVSPLNRFVCLEKFGFTDMLERIKNMTDPINNYIVVNGDKKITIINIYNHVIEHSFIPSIDLEIKKLLVINNFKKALSLLCKLVVCSIVLNKYTVYMNKKDKFKEKFDYTTFVSEINLLHQSKIAILLEKFHNNAKVIIINFME